MTLTTPCKYTEKDIERFWSKADKSGECWLWTAGKFRGGYGRFSHAGRDRCANVVSWEIANGLPVPTGLYVCHACDIPGCVNPDHLWLGTPKENTADCARKGRIARGARHGRGPAKLVATEVTEIHRLYANGVSRPQLAKQFGVDRSTITRIVSRKAWRHIQ